MTHLGKMISFSLLSMAATTALMGCVSILPDPAPADIVYRLDSSAIAVPSAPGASTLRVDRPTAPKALSGQDIIVSPNATQLLTASGARWAEAIPTLVQQAMLEELGQRPSMIGVGPLAGARADLRLHLTIRNFEAQFDRGQDNPPLAIVQYTVTLSEASTRKLIGTHDVRKTVRSDAARVSAIVEAQDKANSQAMSDIANWLESLRLRS